MRRIDYVRVLILTLFAAMVFVPLPVAAADDALLPGEGTWSTAGLAPFSQREAGVTTLRDGRVLIAGGHSYETYTEPRVTLYDPAAEAFTQVASLHKGRLATSAVTLPDGRAAVFGGINVDEGCLSSAEFYDPDTDTWDIVEMPNSAGMAVSGAVLLPDDDVLVVGSQCEEQAAYRYHSDTGAASELTDIPAGYDAGAAMAPLADGRVLLAGGCCAHDSESGATHFFDPTTNQFTRGPDMSTSRRFDEPNELLTLPDGRVLTVGGRNPGDIYDPVTNTWTPTSPNSMGGQLSGVAPLADGTVLVRTMGPRGDEIYDPDTDTWRTTSMSGSDYSFTRGVPVDEDSVVFLAHDGYPMALRYRLGPEPTPTVPNPPVLRSGAWTETDVWFGWRSGGAGGRPELEWHVRMVEPTTAGPFDSERADRSFRREGLAEDTVHVFEVRATNEVGTSDPLVVEIDTGSPGSVETERPSAPQNLVADGRTLTWAPPADEGSAPVESYGVGRVAEGGAVHIVEEGVNDTSYTHDSAVAGETYEYLVVARNAYGYGPGASITHTIPDEPDDTTDPTIELATPVDGAQYSLGAEVLADYSCSDEQDGSGLASCTGPVPDGQPLDTSSAGTIDFTVTAEDVAGNHSLAVATYEVLAGDVTTTASGGETVTTDPSGVGTSSEVPVQTTLAVPEGADGDVSIDAEPPSTDDPEGFEFLGEQIAIEAPATTPEDPYLVTFALDPSALEGVDPADVEVFRDGERVTECTDPNMALPDPCVASRHSADDGSGGAVITVRTSQFSSWNLGRRTRPIAVDTAFTTPQGLPLEIAAPGVLEDSTPEATGQALTAELVEPVGHGTVVLGEDGSVDYTPEPGFVGTDSFTYVAVHEDSVSAPATATISVTPREATTLDVEPVVISLSPFRISVGVATATLTSAESGSAIANQPVSFTAAESEVCQGETDAAGQVKCALSLADQLAVLLEGGVTASFEGTEEYLPADDHEGLAG